jgi:tetratricopeptide (TPR) repeat protein
MMLIRKAVFIFLIYGLGTGCSPKNKKLVSAGFADSLQINYQTSSLLQSVNGNLDFWEKRMDSIPEDFINGPEYAAALVSRYRIYGNIADLHKADSLLLRSASVQRWLEPGIIRNLASLSLLRHQFSRADSLFNKAWSIDGRSVPNLFLSFDISFERGDMQRAKTALAMLQSGNSYGFLFRHSKLEHHQGSLDTAVSYMLRAAERAGTNKHLRQVALSNAADLSFHNGNSREALELYKESLLIDPSDMHSLLGLAWIALIHDKDDSLAEKICMFVTKKKQQPEALLKLSEIAEMRGDSLKQKLYAGMFAQEVLDRQYGLMYTKYLIDLYTGVLKKPALALAIAEADILNRPTPQVYAWYVWSLYCNGQTGKAMDMYKGFVSGKPLEGLELYYMGKFMKGLGKSETASKFFKAAYKNKTDLSPSKVSEVENNL